MINLYHRGIDNSNSCIMRCWSDLNSWVNSLDVCYCNAWLAVSHIRHDIQMIKVKSRGMDEVGNTACMNKMRNIKHCVCKKLRKQTT
jgi:hypothetical protein